MKNAMNILGVLIAATVLIMGGCAAKMPASPPAAQADRKTGEKEIKHITVARVNGSEITMDRVIRMMNRIGPIKDADQKDSLQAVKKIALEQLIMQELALQQARSVNIRPGTDDIDAAIANLKENLGGEQAYKEFLEKQAVTEAEVRADAERGLTLERLYDQEVTRKASVPEDQLKQEYEREKHRYIVPEKVVVTDVYFVKKGDKAPSLKNAKKIRTRINNDPAKDPWKLVLDGTFLVRTIELQKEKHRELYKAAKKMQPGQLSSVIRSDDGLHIMTLKSSSPERQLTFDEVKPSLENKFIVAARQDRLHEWERELKRDAAIEIVDKDMQASQEQQNAGELKQDK